MGTGVVAKDRVLDMLADGVHGMLQRHHVLLVRGAGGTLVGVCTYPVPRSSFIHGCLRAWSTSKRFLGSLSSKCTMKSLAARNSRPR